MPSSEGHHNVPLGDEPPDGTALWSSFESNGEAPETLAAPAPEGARQWQQPRRPQRVPPWAPQVLQPRPLPQL